MLVASDLAHAHRELAASPTTRPRQFGFSTDSRGGTLLYDPPSGPYFQNVKNQLRPQVNPAPTSRKVWAKVFLPAQVVNRL